MKILRPCNECEKEYAAEPRYLNRGQGMYCSRTCSVTANRKLMLAKGVASYEPNVVCAYCDKKFYINDSKKMNSKHGVYFCSRTHKDLGQRIEQGIVAIHPTHYGQSNGKSDYRVRAIAFYGADCQNCKDSRFREIHEVNHRDVNRENNSIENLEVLCPTCHRLFHWLIGTGHYVQKVMSLEEANKLFYRDLSEYFK